MSIEQGSLLKGRYRILGVLGQGGMGSVYRALDESLGVEVAIKENLFTTDEYIRQFKREAVILASLRHPNLPRVTEHFIEDDVHYLVMDFVEGDDLRQRMDRFGKLPEDEVIKCGASICEALTYLHSRNPSILHRDIKPGNVKLTPDGRVILVDFGLAKVVQGSQDTTIGARAMTPGYSPPEQYGTNRTDPRSDVYALGATLYAALTGVIPEDGLLRLMDNLPLTPLEKYNAQISRRTAAVIEKAMAVRPEERYQTTEEFRQALTGETKPAAKEKRAPEFPPAALSVKSEQASQAGSEITTPKTRSNAAWLIGIVIIAAVALTGWIGQDQLRGMLIKITPAPQATNTITITLPSETLEPTASPQPTETLAPITTQLAAPTNTAQQRATVTRAPQFTATPTPQAITAITITPASLEIFHRPADDSIAALITSLAALDPNQTPILNPLPAEGGDPIEVLNARLTAGQPPDTFEVSAGTNLKSYADAGMIAPLGEFYTNTDYANLILPPVWSAVSFDGEPYAVPYKIHPRNVLYYNKARLDSVGFVPPKTFEELYTLCGRFKEKYPSVECISIATSDPAQVNQLFDAMLIGNGGMDDYANLFTGQTDLSIDPDFKASLQDIIKIRQHLIANHADADAQTAIDLVANGRALFYFGDETTMQRFAAFGTEIDRVLFPANAILFSADAYTLPANAPQMNLSIHWLTMLTFPEVQVAASQESGLFISAEVDPLSVIDPLRQSMITVIDQTPDNVFLSRYDLLPAEFNAAFGQMLIDFIDDPFIDATMRAANQLISDYDIAADTIWYAWK
jgi:ABC-type glycerol-3-phosphate transport system substrate-binding protein